MSLDYAIGITSYQLRFEAVQLLLRLWRIRLFILLLPLELLDGLFCVLLLLALLFDTRLIHQRCFLLLDEIVKAVNALDQSHFDFFIRR